MATSLTLDGLDVLPFLLDRSLELKNTGYAQTGTLSFALTGLLANFVVGGPLLGLEDYAGHYSLENGTDNLAPENQLRIREEAEVVMADFGSPPVPSLTLEDGSGHYALEDGSGAISLESVVQFAGLVRNLKKLTYEYGPQLLFQIDCQDYTTLADANVITTPGISGIAGTDRDRIVDLFGSFGTKGIQVGVQTQTLVASMPQQNYYGKTLAQALDMILAISGGTWYIDYSKRLHTFLVETSLAPFGLSDVNDGVATFGYRDLVLPSETTQLENAVFYIPFAAPAVATWYLDQASIDIYGRFEASVTSKDITLQADLAKAGAGYLTAHAYPIKTGSLTCFQLGLAAGMVVAISNANYGLLATLYQITSVDTTFPNQNAPEFKVEFGSPRRTLAVELAAMVR